MVIYGVAPYSVMFGIDPSQYLMNGLFNLMFQYGFLSTIIIIIFLVRRDVIISIYLLSCMMFNGSFLVADKIAVICVTIAFYYAIQYRLYAIANGGQISTH